MTALDLIREWAPTVGAVWTAWKLGVIERALKLVKTTVADHETRIDALEGAPPSDPLPLRVVKRAS